MGGGVRAEGRARSEKSIKEERRRAGGRASERGREGGSEGNLAEREHKVTQRSNRHTGFDIPPQPHTDLHLLRMRQTAETRGAAAAPRAVL